MPSTLSLIDKMTHVESRIEYIFKDKSLLGTALNNGPERSIHLPSYLHNIMNNRRLAIYGEIIARALLCRAWYNNKDYDKTDYKVLCKIYLGEDWLARRGCQLKFDDCLIESNEEAGDSDSKMVTAMQAILGAVHVEGGELALLKVMRVLGVMDIGSEADPPASEDDLAGWEDYGLPTPEGDLPTPEDDLAGSQDDLPTPEDDLPTPEDDLPTPEDDLPTPEDDLP